MLAVLAIPFFSMRLGHVDAGANPASFTSKQAYDAIGAGAAFLLLLLTFRSPVLAVKAAILNLLSIGAAYGVVVAVFQWGWGSSLRVRGGRPSCGISPLPGAARRGRAAILPIAGRVWDCLTCERRRRCERR